MTIRLGSFQLGHMNIQEALKRTFYHKDLTWIKNNDRVFIHIIMITGTVSYTSTRTLPRLLPPPPLHKKCRRAHTHLSKHASRHTHSVIVHPLTTHSIHWNTWQPPANQLISMTSIQPSFFLNLPPPPSPQLSCCPLTLSLSLSLAWFSPALYSYDSQQSDHCQTVILQWFMSHELLGIFDLSQGRATYGWVREGDKGV